MKYCTFLMCLLAVPAYAQTPEEMYDFYLKFDGDAIELSREEEDNFFGYIESLFYAEKIIVEVRQFPSRNNDESERITAQRRALIEEMFLENRVDASVVEYLTVQGRFDDSPLSSIRIQYRNPKPGRVVRRKEADYTDKRGFRVHCYASDVNYIKRADVSFYTEAADFEAFNLNTTGEEGERLEIAAVVSITMPSDTVFGTPVKIQVPLHGLDEVGCKEYMLMQQGDMSFATSESKAGIKRDNDLMLWKMDVDRSVTLVLARPTRDTQKIQFTAPEGYVILSGSAVSVSPYLNCDARLSQNQLVASFDQLPDLENVFCSFELSDMQGHRFTIPRTCAKSLMTSPMLTWMKRNENTLPSAFIAQKK